MERPSKAGRRNRRLTIVQYAGDYREAFERLSGGGPETYQAQRYSVETVGELASELEQVAVICALSDERYDVVLPNGVRSIGAGFRFGFEQSDLIPALERTSPSHVLLATPLVPVLRWIAAKRISAIVPLADSFNAKGLRSWLRHKRLAYHLNHKSIDWVGNHGINACTSLANIGVDANKIIPWDWPPSRKPSDFSERALREKPPHRLLYVGSVTEEKGVTDLIRAVLLLRERHFEVALTIIGHDRDCLIERFVQSLQLADHIQFAGVQPNDQIVPAMRAADVVVVPSRHEYPEGLPLTIYEALVARTPIVASDHPMFRGILVHEKSAVIFRAGDTNSLAEALAKALTDRHLYQHLSWMSASTWTNLQLSVSWGRLLRAWISGEPADHSWIFENRLASGKYKTPDT